MHQRLYEGRESYLNLLGGIVLGNDMPANVLYLRHNHSSLVYLLDEFIARQACEFIPMSSVGFMCE